MKLFYLLFLSFFLTHSAHAEVSANYWAGAVRIGPANDTCNSGIEGAIRYNSVTKFHETCNGTTWTAMAQVQTTPGPTAPAGSGYFVLTNTTWNGNLGGLAGANAKCLTELGTTYTGWRGYTAANAAGQITAAKIRALLCDEGSCNNLMPLTTYYFAYANSATPGGASFTTDASGIGPGDSANWSAANYFSGTYSYWSNRADGSATKWATTHYTTAANSCYGFTYSGASTTTSGRSGSSDSGRWVTGGDDCSNPNRLICYVNP